MEFFLSYVVIGFIIAVVTGSIEMGAKWIFLACGTVYRLISGLISGRSPFDED